MIKVLEILTSPIRCGGTQMFVLQLIKSLDKEINIDCLTPLYREDENFEKQLLERGGTLYALNLNHSKNLNYVYRPIKKFLKDRSYDIIHIHASTIQELAAIAAATKHNKSARVIVHSHGSGSNFTILMRLFRAIASISMKKHVDYYCACSKSAAEWKFTPKYQKQTHIISNGINTKQFRFNPVCRNDIRSKLQISDSEFVLGNVGRLYEIKNQSFLLSVFSEFLQKRPDSKLILVGDGPDRNALEQLAEQKGIADRVIFVGNTNEVAGYLMAMDVFVFPSKHEAFGYAVIEAQASGLPVIASNRLPDAVKLSENVSFLPIDNDCISKWVDAISSAHCEKRDNGIEIVRKAGYDLETTVKQVEELYFSSSKIKKS